MKHIYQCIETFISDKELGEYVSYGIEIKNKNGDVVQCIEDISVEKQLVEKLVNLCNYLSVDITHIEDIIEDFLVDFEV